MANAKISDNSVFLTTVTDVLNIDGFAAYSTASATGNAAMRGTQLGASLETNINLSNMSSGTLPASRGGTGITDFSLANFANDNVDYSNDGSGVLPFAKGGTGVNSFAGSGFVTTSGSSFNFTSSIDLSSSDVSNVLPINKGGTGASTAGVPTVGGLLDEGSQVIGDSLIIEDDGSGNSVLSTGKPKLVDLPVASVRINSNALLADMTREISYVVPFSEQTISNTDYYTFTANSTSTKGDWNSYIQILKAGTYIVNARIGMYNAHTFTTYPSLTMWIETLGSAPTALSEPAFPVGRSTICLASGPIDQETNGLGLICGTTIITVSANDYIRLIVRTEDWSSTLPYFVYNDVSVTGGDLAGHRPTLQITKIA